MKHSLNDLLEKAKATKYFCFLNSNGYSQGFVDKIAFGDEACSWDDLRFNNDSKYFGFLSYDLKDQLFPSLKSENKDWQQFPQSTFFDAKRVVVESEWYNDLQNEIKVTSKVSLDNRLCAVPACRVANTRTERGNVQQASNIM